MSELMCVLNNNKIIMDLLEKEKKEDNTSRYFNIFHVLVKTMFRHYNTKIICSIL